MGQLSCPFKTSRGLGVRAAPWSAVAAATAFLVLALAPLPYEPQAEGGSCCYRSPRRRRRNQDVPWPSWPCRSTGGTPVARLWLQLRRAVLLALHSGYPMRLECLDFWSLPRTGPSEATARATCSFRRPSSGRTLSIAREKTRTCGPRYLEGRFL